MQRAVHMVSRGAAAAAPGVAIVRASVSGARNTIKSNTVVLFVKSYCPVCNDLAERFEDAEVAFKRVALDFYDNGNEIRDKLKEQTKQPHVPYVFIAGAHMPSETVISGMKSPGALKPTLEQAGVEVKGYFRS